MPLEISGWKPALRLCVPWLRLPVFVELVARPKQPARDEVEVNILAHRFVAVANRRAENAGLAGSVDPNDGVLVVGLARREGFAERHAVGPFLEDRSEEHTSELQSRLHLVCRL